MDSTGADGNEARQPRRALMMVRDGRVAVALALAAFAAAAWAILRTPPQSTPSSPSPALEPDYTCGGIERAQHEMEKEQHYEEELRQDQ